MQHRKAQLGKSKEKYVAPNPERTWVEDVTQLQGFIRVDDASDVVNLGHTGWYTDEFESDTFIPIIVALRGKDRMLPRYFSGYRESYGGGNSCCLDMTSYAVTEDRSFIYGYKGVLITDEESRREYQGEDFFTSINEEAMRQAAWNADDIAKRAAEEAQEYEFTWRLEQDIEEVVTEYHENNKTCVLAIKSWRTSRLALIQADLFSNVTPEEHTYCLELAIGTVFNSLKTRKEQQKTLGRLREELSRGF
jgi:hypothetical protein